MHSSIPLQSDSTTEPSLAQSPMKYMEIVALSCIIQVGKIEVAVPT
jgi:hypothetical protein